ncbi:MAG: alpha/beta fold hydrolase [Chloroflexi bacterium]|nr:alpha/beta fold hydrolase [Chloroflexota bacterium]
MDDALPYSTPEHQPFLLKNGDSGALLIHGFVGTPAEMRPIGEALHERGWSVHAPRLPGFGQDIVTLEDRRAEDWLAAAEAAWHELKRHSSHCIVVGHSMGASLAIRLAAGDLDPQALVLTAPFWKLDNPWAPVIPIAKHFVPKVRPFENADFSDPQVRREFERMLPGVDLDDPDVQERLREETALPTGAVHQLMRAGRMAYDGAPHVRVPTLIIQGSHDATVPVRLTERLRERFRNGLLRYVEIQAGHDMVKAESPSNGRVVELVVDYVNKVVA